VKRNAIPYAGNQRLHSEMQRLIDDFHNLASALPTDWPRHPYYRITDAQMHSYDANRINKYWHEYNLPLALHVYGQSRVADARTFRGCPRFSDRERFGRARFFGFAG
jgi:hypothetical protein